MAPSPPWDPFAAVIVEALRDAILAHAERRISLTRALHRAPLVCREARDQFRQQPLASWLLMYQLHAHCSSDFRTDLVALYDNVPSTIDFEQSEHADDWRAPGNASWRPVGVGSERFPDTTINTNLQRILDARLGVARLLDSEDDCEPPHSLASMAKAKWAPLGRFLATDGLPEGLPLVVRNFVGFMRFLASTTAATLRTDAAIFVDKTDSIVPQQCSRKGCSRNACVRKEAPDAPPRPRSTCCGPLDGTLPYWELCRTGELPNEIRTNSTAISLDPLSNPTPFATTSLAYCSRVCAEQTNAEFDRLVRCFGDDGQLVNTVEFVRLPRAAQGRRGGDGGARSHGEKQLRAACLDAIPPSRLHVAAMARNEKLRRLLERPCVTQTEPTHLPFDRAALASLRRELIIALNVDTALLYAASLINELPPAVRPRKTLPHCLAWRKQSSATLCYFKVVLTIRDLYLRELKDNPPHLLTLSTTQPRWMQKLKDNLLTLF